MATTNSTLPRRDFSAADALPAPPDPLALRDLARALPANGNDADLAGEEEGPVSGRRLSTRGHDGPDVVGEDTALVHAACARDPRAQTRIWRKYAPLVRARLRGSIGVRDLDDLVQEVFLRLFVCLPALRQPSALRSFIIGISIRVAGTELRRRGSRWWLRLMPTDASCDELGGTYRFDEEGHEAFARFEAILAQLGPYARRMFELRYVEDKGLATVADTMGVSLATAKRHLARVHAQVMAMVAHDEVLRGYAYDEEETASDEPATVDADEALRATADAANASDAALQPEEVDPSASVASGEQTTERIANGVDHEARDGERVVIDEVSARRDLARDHRFDDVSASCLRNARLARRCRRAPPRASPRGRRVRLPCEARAFLQGRCRIREKPSIDASRGPPLRFDPEAIRRLVAPIPIARAFGSAAALSSRATATSGSTDPPSRATWFRHARTRSSTRSAP